LTLLTHILTNLRSPSLWNITVEVFSCANSLQKKVNLVCDFSMYSRLYLSWPGNEADRTECSSQPETELAQEVVW
jgi:hypothetical protein